MDPVVTTEWLSRQLASADLVVFDATKYLPGEPFDGREKFREAHIPGARFFDIDEIADPDSTLPHMVPSPARFESKMSAMGVSNSSRVVFYDQNGLASAARGWWLFGLFGHDRVAVLDGGLPKWRREGKLVEAGEPDAPIPAGFKANFRAARLRGIGDMLRNLESKSELVLDARPPGRFHGTVPEPRPNMRGGHIPGSRNLPATALLNENKTLRSKNELRALFREAGVEGNRPVVTSCGSGVTAAILTLGMKLADYPEGALYDGSWSEWGGRPDTPVEQG